MSYSLSRKAAPSLLAALGMLLLPIAARAHDRGPASDAWITTRAKIALFTANIANATMVHVDTNNCRVILYGKVQTEAQKQKAEDTVRGIAGVTKVQNMLQVVPASEQREVTTSDERIKEQMENSLSQDPILAKDQISVKSVNNGAVLLTGGTENLSEKLNAIEIAYDVPGVKAVTTEIKVRHDTTAETSYVPDDEKANNTGSSPTMNKLNEGARDAWLVTASKLRFIADPDVPALDIGVDASHNVVTLFGSVPTDKAKAQAESDVQKVDSSIVVHNELEIVPESVKPVVEARDANVKHSVQKALGARGREFKGITVEVRNGVVRLSGKVRSSMESLKAALIARTTRGVKAVQDDLKSA